MNVVVVVLVYISLKSSQSSTFSYGSAGLVLVNRPLKIPCSFFPPRVSPSFWSVCRPLCIVNQCCYICCTYLLSSFLVGMVEQKFLILMNYTLLIFQFMISSFFFLKIFWWLRSHTVILVPGEAEVGESQVQGQPGQLTKILSHLVRPCLKIKSSMEKCTWVHFPVPPKKIPTKKS